MRHLLAVSQDDSVQGILQNALDNANDDFSLKVYLHTQIAILSKSKNDTILTEQLFKAALKTAKGAGLPALVAKVDTEFGKWYLERKKYDDAEELLVSCTKVIKKLMEESEYDYSENLIEIYHTLGALFLEKEDFYEADYYYQKLLNARVPVLHEVANVDYHFMMVDAYHYLEKHERTLVHLNKIEADHSGWETFRDSMNWHYRSGVSMLKIGNIGSAKWKFESTISMAKQLKDTVYLANAHYGLGDALNDLGLYEDAIVQLKEAIELYVRLGWREDEIRTYVILGNAHYNKENYPKSREYYASTETKANEVNDTLTSIYCRMCVADIYQENRKFTTAISRYKGVLGTLHNYSNQMVEAMCWSNIGDCNYEMNRLTQAIADYGKALEIAVDQDLVLEQLINHYNLGWCHLSMKRYEESAKFFKEANALCAEVNDEGWTTAVCEAFAFLKFYKDYPVKLPGRCRY